MIKHGRLSAIYTLAYATFSTPSPLAQLASSGALSSASAFRSPSARIVRRHQRFVATRPTQTRMAADDNDDPLTRKGLPSPLLLGSASFTRKLILGEMNIAYHKVVRPIDEKSLGDRSKDAPRDLVLTLAKAKMDHLVREITAGRCVDDMPASAADSNGEWIVLTGDQVVTHAGKILEKPESIDEARRFVRGYAEEPCGTVGSCVLTHLPSGIRVSGVDTATIHFKPTIGGELVDEMLREGAPILSCAGGLMIEHPLVREHVDRIDGTEDSVMGLSKDLVNRLLGELKDKLDEESQALMKEKEAVVRRYFEGVNKKDPQMMASCFADRVELRDMCGPSKGKPRMANPKDMADRCLEFLVAHPDCRVEFDRAPVCDREGKWVWCHWHETGTWSGSSLGVPPEGTKLDVGGHTRFLLKEQGDGSQRIAKQVVFRTFSEWELSLS